MEVSAIRAEEEGQEEGEGGARESGRQSEGHEECLLKYQQLEEHLLQQSLNSLHHSSSAVCAHACVFSLSRMENICSLHGPDLIPFHFSW